MSLPSVCNATDKTEPFIPEGVNTVSTPPGGSLKLSSSTMLMMPALILPSVPAGEAFESTSVIERAASGF